MEITVRKLWRAKNLAGTLVRNPEKDDIGEIEDVVIEMESGKVAYAILNFRTWFQDKLFAIPWTELSLTHDDEDRFFVLDTTRDTLKSAPGFTADDWPDVATDEWREKVDAHYRNA